MEDCESVATVPYDDNSKFCDTFDHGLRNGEAGDRLNVAYLTVKDI